VMYRTQLQHALERELRDRMGVPESWETDQKKILWHKEQLARLEKADAAPRCEHIYSDGTRCQAPKLKTGQWCYAHERMKSVRTKKLSLLPTEDANSIMLNLGDIGRALINDEISEKKAGLLMYNQQLGLIALSRVTFKETDGRLMVREAPTLPQLPQSPELKTGSPQRAQGTRRKNQKKILPLMNADGTDHADQKLEPNTDGGSLPVAAEQTRRSTQHPALSIQRDKQIRGSCQTAAEQAPQHRVCGSPGLLPIRTKSASNGDSLIPGLHVNSGVESAKSNGFGVDGAGVGEGRVLPSY
jgi:hypothetical protein